MNEMPSSEFRRQYAKLAKPVSVTVNGHAIGHWFPADYSLAIYYEGADSADPPGVVLNRLASQKARDDLLRKNNRGK